MDLAHGNQNITDTKPSSFYLINYAIHLSYAIPSLIRYVNILYNIKNSSFSKMSFYKLYIVDGYIVSFVNYFLIKLNPT